MVNHLCLLPSRSGSISVNRAEEVGLVASVFYQHFLVNVLVQHVIRPLHHITWGYAITESLYQGACVINSSFVS